MKRLLLVIAIFTLQGCNTSIGNSKNVSRLSDNMYTLKNLRVGDKYGSMAVADVNRVDGAIDGDTVVTFSGATKIGVYYVNQDSSIAEKFTPTGVCVRPVKSDWHMIPMGKGFGQELFCLEGETSVFPHNSSGKAEITIDLLIRKYVGMETYDTAKLVAVESVVPDTTSRTFSDVFYKASSE